MVNIDLSKNSLSGSLLPRHRGKTLRHLAACYTELFRLIGGWLPGLDDWEGRRVIGSYIFRDARRVQELRVRCRELGAAPSEIHESVSAPGMKMIEALSNFANADEAIGAAFLRGKGKILDLLKDFLNPELDLFDAPSLPVLENLCGEIERQIEWVRSRPFAAASGETRPEVLEDFERALAGLCEELMRELPAASLSVGSGRKMGNLPLLQSTLPKGFRPLENGMAGGQDSYPQRALYHAHNFLQEIQAGDTCASLLFEAPDMPWEFYFDVSRHLWDEMRHCEFGERKLKQLGVDFRSVGLSNTAYVLRQTLSPVDRYAALATQEADAFPGKHQGLQDALAHRDDLSATAWSYDIADETQHVRYGQKWLPVLIAQSGEARDVEQLKADAENWRREVLAAGYRPAAIFFGQK